MRLSDDKVKCDICNIELLADDFAEHAINMHDAECLDLLSDDMIIDGLATWVK